MNMDSSFQVISKRHKGINVLLFLVGLHLSGSVEDTRFLGVGYNLLTGNPDGGLTSQGGIDQGLLYTRKIFDVTNPHAVQSEKRSGCSKVKSTSVFYGGKSYQDKLKTGVSIGGGANVGIASFAFSLSPRFEKARHETTNEHKVFQDEQTTCNLGRERFKSELAQAYSLSVTQGFAASVCKLLSYYDKHNYMRFLDQWGTHMTMEVELGYKNTSRYESSLSSFVEHVNQVSGVDVNVGGSYMGYGGSLEVNFEQFKSRSEFQTKFGSYQTTLRVGTPAMPEPIGLKVEPIHTALDSVYWQNHTMLTHPGVCLASDLNDLDSIKANLVRALADYATYKQAALPSDPDLRIPLAWPRGTYGLYMASAGCPLDRTTAWFSGWRSQDGEDFNSGNQWSSPIHLHGDFDESTITTYFCIKGTAKSDLFALDCPKGDYCVLKYGACPSGFQEGWLTWDDEDSDNHNDYGGYLPDGVYDDNTKMYYCCRNDSLPTVQINLPKSSPFYLLRHSRTCQRVRGMRVVEEFVFWDEEWHLFVTKDQKSGGAHPYDDGDHDNHKVHFCYYYPDRWSIHDGVHSGGSAGLVG